jgi:hypothetical protein
MVAETQKEIKAEITKISRQIANLESDKKENNEKAEKSPEMLLDKNIFVRVAKTILGLYPEKDTDEHNKLKQDAKNEANKLNQEIDKKIEELNTEIKDLQGRIASSGDKGRGDKNPSKEDEGLGSDLGDNQEASNDDKIKKEDKGDASNGSKVENDKEGEEWQKYVQERELVNQKESVR